MESVFLNKFRTLVPAKRAQMVLDAPNHICDTNFLNMLSNLDLNDVDPKNKSRPSSIYFVCGQMRAFHDMPRFQAEVKAWLQAH